MIISEKVGSKYRYIILAGQRVAQLQKGARPRVEGLEDEKNTAIATSELDKELLQFKILEREGSEAADADGEGAGLMAPAFRTDEGDIT